MLAYSLHSTLLHQKAKLSMVGSPFEKVSNLKVLHKFERFHSKIYGYM